MRCPPLGVVTTTLPGLGLNGCCDGGGERGRRRKSVVECAGGKDVAEGATQGIRLGMRNQASVETEAGLTLCLGRTAYMIPHHGKVDICATGRTSDGRKHAHVAHGGGHADKVQQLGASATMAVACVGAAVGRARRKQRGSKQCLDCDAGIQ